MKPVLGFVPPSIPTVTPAVKKPEEPKRRIPKCLQSALRSIAFYVIGTTFLIYWLEPVMHYFPHQMNHADTAELCGIYAAGILAIALVFDVVLPWRQRRKRAK